MSPLVHYLNIAFNVSKHEWPRIILSWLIKFFTHTVFVMGTTILVALFVEKYSINHLPYLYIVTAIFVVIGSVIFSFFMERFDKKNEIFIFTFVASLFFIIAPYSYNFIIAFYLIVLVALSIFISQLNIILALFIEELFSPLESERTFPIIESSEPIGGIFAGAILYIGVTSFHLSALDFYKYMAIILFLIIPTLFIFFKFANKVPKLESHEEINLRVKNRIEKSKNGIRHIKGMSFLKGLFVIVFLHFMLVNLIEFQYTSILNQSIFGNSSINTQNNSENYHNANVNKHKKVESHSYADALTHGLAVWHVSFSLLAFLAQILSASRIHTHLGIIRSLKLHPLINLMSGIALFKFGFITGILARGVFEITTIMHRTTYHASFYVLKKSIREHVKEFMEGIVRPLGVISGTLLLALVLYIVPEESKHTAITLCIILIALIMYLVLLQMQSQYTLLAKKNLDSKNSHIEKIEAIEILAQKGHEKVSDILGKNLHDKQNEQVVCKILETLGTIQEINSIPDILKMFDSKNKNIKLAAVQSLTNFKNLGAHFFHQSFAKHRIINSLEELFVQTKSKKIKSAVVQVFKNINNAEIVPFLLKTLDNEDEEIVADAIYVCGLFNDINSAYYLEKYLYHENPRIKSAAIIALWNFSSLRLKALIQLTAMLESKEEDMKISGIYTIGEIKTIQEIPRLKKLIEHENLYIQCHAKIALAKMNQDFVVHGILELLFHEDPNIVQITRKLLLRIPKNVKNIIKNLLVQEVSHKIHTILEESNTAILEHISDHSLRKLKMHYEIIYEVKEVLRIEEELEKRKNKITD